MLAPFVRALREGGVPAIAIVPPDLESVKTAHAAGLVGVELHTGAIVDLPEPSRAPPRSSASATRARLAAKLRLDVGVAGGLGVRDLAAVLAAAPVAERVVVGRAFVARATLVGVERAVRDLLDAVA